MDLQARADQSYYQAWRAWGRCGQGEVRESNGLLAVSSGTPLAFLNIVFVTRPLAAPEDQLGAAMRFFDSRGEPFIVRIREGLDRGSEAACDALGMPYSDTVPGMVSTNLLSPAAPDGLDVQVVRSLSELDQFQSVIADGYGLPRGDVDAFVRPALLEDAEVESYVGYFEGKPIATSTLAFGGGVAGVHNVSTVPAARKRGFGEALTWHAMARGAGRGCDMAALQASEMGQPIYERMGFRVVSRYRTFHRPGV
jgi:GNAT superfamily N-acetyltransferase